MEPPRVRGAGREGRGFFQDGDTYSFGMTSMGPIQGK